MDAPEPLLLSEDVYRQLGIVTYCPDLDAIQSKAVSAESIVLTARVQLVKSTQVPPRPDHAECSSGSEMEARRIRSLAFGRDPFAAE